MQNLWAAVQLCINVCVLLCHSSDEAPGRNMLQDRSVLGFRATAPALHAPGNEPAKTKERAHHAACCGVLAWTCAWVCCGFLAAAVPALRKHIAVQAGQNMWLWTGGCVLDIRLCVEECQLDWVCGAEVEGREQCYGCTPGAELQVWAGRLLVIGRAFLG
jgi:hypothetical protein